MDPLAPPPSATFCGAVIPSPLMALTLRQPWATAIRDLGKRVENRTWRPPAHMLGQTIAIHAGKTFDEPGADWIAARTGRMTTATNVPIGAVIALARIRSVITEGSSDDFWFSGPYGWHFENVIRLEPVPCPGRRQLWTLPDAIRSEIIGQLTKSEN